MLYHNAFIIYLFATFHIFELHPHQIQSCSNPIMFKSGNLLCGQECLKNGKLMPTSTIWVGNTVKEGTSCF